MFLYRDHKGGLSESMETVQEMDSLSDIRDHLEPTFGPGEITVEDYGRDECIKWDTYIVCHNGRAVGFTNGPVIPIDI